MLMSENEQAADGSWLQIEVERVLYVHHGRDTILCDRSAQIVGPHGGTLLVRMSAASLKSLQLEAQNMAGGVVETDPEKIAQICEYADLHAGAVDAMRRWAKEGLGFNCTFVDDDMKVVVGLAQRAVLAGLASDFPRDMQRRFLEAAEKHRSDHEKSLARPLSAGKCE